MIEIIYTFIQQNIAWILENLKPFLFGAGAGAITLSLPTIMSFLVNLFLSNKKLKKEPKIFVYNNAYKIGSFLRKNVTSKIADVSKRVATRKYFGGFGDEFNRGLDDGLENKVKAP